MNYYGIGTTETDKQQQTLDTVAILQKTYPILKQRSIIQKVLNALNTQSKIAVSPSTIIGMYLQEAQREQRV